MAHMPCLGESSASSRNRTAPGAWRVDGNADGGTDWMPRKRGKRQTAGAECTGAVARPSRRTERHLFHRIRSFRFRFRGVAAFRIEDIEDRQAGTRPRIPRSNSAYPRATTSHTVCPQAGKPDFQVTASALFHIKKGLAAASAQTARARARDMAKRNVPLHPATRSTAQDATPPRITTPLARMPHL